MADSSLTLLRRTPFVLAVETAIAQLVAAGSDQIDSTTKASILTELGLTDIVVTDTEITITKLGADLVTRTIILPLE